MTKSLARSAKNKRGTVRSGLVAYSVRGVSGKKRARQFTPAQMIDSVRMGLPIGELDALQSSLGIPMERLALKLGISKATLHRRKHSGRLAAEESGRILRFARLTGRAVEVFDTLANARQWLSAPQAGLGGATPLDYAGTEIGAREVEDLLGRIEYGVYS